LAAFERELSRRVVLDGEVLHLDILRSRNVSLLVLVIVANEQHDHVRILQVLLEPCGRCEERVARIGRFLRTADDGDHRHTE